MKTETVKASNINHGDTIIINGKEFTVNGEYIKNGFFGTTIHGHNIKGSVERVLFPKWYKGKIVKYVPQI